MPGYLRPMLRQYLLASLAFIAVPAFAQPRANPAGPDQFICGNAATMQADPLGTGETGVWTIVQGTATFANQSSPTTLITGLSSGENVLRWTIYPPGAETISDLVSLWCHNPAMPDANAGPDQTVTLWPGSTQLAGSAPIAPGACIWIVVAGSCTLADPTDPNTTISNLNAGTIVLEWSCDNGPCGTTSDFVSIDVAVGVDEIAPLVASLRYDAVQHALVITGTNEAMDLMILDAQGRQVQAMRAPGGTGLWRLDALPSGVYTVAARDRDQRALRFVVSR